MFKKILPLSHIEDIEKGVKRQFLHAYRVKFTHPATKKEMEIEISLPEDMKEFLEK